MIDENLKFRIDRAITESKDLDVMFKVLYDFKFSGGQQQDALDTLQHMRDGASEEYEGLILEVMDFAAGFCSPRYKVWPKTMDDEQA